jgi:predicted AlkP superfamily phosphohydrolase/phosphomutase
LQVRNQVKEQLEGIRDDDQREVEQKIQYEENQEH